MNRKIIRNLFIKHFFPYLVSFIFYSLLLYWILFIPYKTNIENTYNVQISSIINSIRQQFDTDFRNIRRIDYIVKNSFRAGEASRNNEYNQIVSNRYFKNYIFSNALIKDAILYNNEMKIVCSSLVTLNGNDMLTQDGRVIPINLEKMTTVEFDYQKLNDTDYILFYPRSNLISPINCLYILNYAEIEKTLSNALGIGITKLCLLNSDGKKIIEIRMPENSSEKIDDLSTESFDIINGEIKLRVTRENSYLDYYFRQSLVNLKYLIILCFIVYFIIVWISLQFNYKPIKTLFLKICGDESNLQSTNDLIRKIDINQQKSKELVNIINNYRETSYKCIFKTIFQNTEKTISDQVIDNFFNPSVPNVFYVIKVSTIIPISIFQERIDHISSVFITGEENGNLILLVNSFQQLGFGREAFIKELEKIADKKGCFIGVSSESMNPMELSNLYEQAADSLLNCSVSRRVCLYSRKFEQRNYSYPQDKMSHLSGLLDSLELKTYKQELIELTNSLKSNYYPTFFISCIFVDILTDIVTHMNSYDIKLETYYAQYKKINKICKQTEDNNEMIICDHLCGLIDIFEREISGEGKFNIIIVVNFIDKNFTSYDMSLNFLADKFGVSTPYLSKLFKQKFNQNISDYIWGLRFHLACNLLKNESINVEQIASMVGYENYTSFNRKFKGEIGLTPNAYRMKYRDHSQYSNSL